MKLDRREVTGGTEGTDGERLIDLYTYLCVDGVARTRCRRHIATEGPYRMLSRPYHVKHVEWYRCVECYEFYLWEKAQEKPVYEQATDINQQP